MQRNIIELRRANQSCLGESLGLTFLNFIYLILNLHALRYNLDVMVNYDTIFNKIHIQMLALLGRSEVLYFL